MTSLLIDSCTEHGIVTLFSDGKILFNGEIPVGNHSSKFMMPEVDKGLRQLGLKVRNLKYIAVSVGPGSYTGIRIGVVIAKTLAYAGEVPLVSFSSLNGFIPPDDGLFAALIDAKIGGAYIKLGERKMGEVTWFTEAVAVSLEELEVTLQTVKYIVSPNAKSIRIRLEKIYPNFKKIWIETAPNSEYLAQCAESLFLKGCTHNGNELEILYLRKTQAEIERGES